MAVKIVQPSVEKILFLQLRNESHCRFPTYLLLKLITVSVFVLSFRAKSSVLQVLLKEKKRIHRIFHASKLSNQPSKRIFTKKSNGFFDIVNISLDSLLFESLHSSGSQPNQPTSSKLVTQFHAILR